MYSCALHSVSRSTCNNIHQRKQKDFGCSNVFQLKQRTAIRTTKYQDKRRKPDDDCDGSTQPLPSLPTRTRSTATAIATAATASNTNTTKTTTAAATNSRIVLDDSNNRRGLDEDEMSSISCDVDEESVLHKRETYKFTNSKRRLVANHVMVNACREAYGLKSLWRNSVLDAIAKNHADHMACTRKVVHSVQSMNELRTRLRSSKVGENVQRGESIGDMHDVAIRGNGSCLQNIMDPRFKEMGMATSTSRVDGKVYMVQLFRGEITNDA